MAEKLISYTTGDDANKEFEGGTWLAQTFTVDGTNIVASSAKVYVLSYSGGGEGYMYIKATDGEGKPTGGTLATASVTWPGGWGQQIWVEGTFSSAVGLTASTKYALIIRRVPTQNQINWRYDSSLSQYTGGTRASSSNSGTTWTLSEGDTDFLFEIWGTEGATSYVDITGTVSGTGSIAGTLTTGDRLEPPTITYWTHFSGGFYYRLIIQSDGTYGTTPEDGGVENADYEVLSGYLPSTIRTARRLLAVTRNSLYYENT